MKVAGMIVIVVGWYERERERKKIDSEDGKRETVRAERIQETTRETRTESRYKYSVNHDVCGCLTWYWLLLCDGRRRRTTAAGNARLEATTDDE